MVYMCVHMCECACVPTTKNTLVGTLTGEGARLSAQEVATNVEAIKKDDQSRYRAKNIISGLLYFESFRNLVIAGPVLYAPINLIEVSEVQNTLITSDHTECIVKFRRRR